MATTELQRTCALADLLPDDCRGSLHSHHVMPRSAGGADEGPQVWVCAHHHPMLEHLARRVLRWKTCPHRPGTHRYPGAREACERRLNLAA